MLLHTVRERVMFQLLIFGEAYVFWNVKIRALKCFNLIRYTFFGLLFYVVLVNLIYQPLLTLLTFKLVLLLTRYRLQGFFYFVLDLSSRLLGDRLQYVVLFCSLTSLVYLKFSSLSGVPTHFCTALIGSLQSILDLYRCDHDTKQQ